ncbi:MAG TPA: hypothetical protein VGV35_06170, partial [Bryobacteraceae bacterium]|nr:hypothetical protein [Bryobacteraceae bacterium]
MQAALYGFLGASFTIATAGSLGMLLIRGLRRSRYDLEERLFSVIIGSVYLSAIVFFLCAAHLARKSVFLAIGLSIILLAVRFGAYRIRGEMFPPMPRVWKWIFISIFVAVTVFYVFKALAPQPFADPVTQRLSLVDRAHGFVPNPGIARPRIAELLLLFAFAIGRHSAAELVNLALLATLSLLVLSFG